MDFFQNLSLQAVVFSTDIKNLKLCLVSADGLYLLSECALSEKTDTILWLDVAVKTSRGEGLVLKFAMMRGANAARGHHKNGEEKNTG